MASLVLAQDILFIQCISLASKNNLDPASVFFRSKE